MLCFAGHGREGDGALVLNDGVVTPKELLDALAGIAGGVSAPGRLRVSVALASCHTAAFTTGLLDSCLRARGDRLGHGMFTYVFSLQPASPLSFGAKAVQPDNTFGPSLAIAHGELGCSHLTAGVQNPVTYYNGGPVIEVCGRYVNLFRDDNHTEYIGLEEMRARLKRHRDEVTEAIRRARPDMRFGVRPTDAENRAYIRETVEMLSRDDPRRPEPAA